MPDPHTLEGQVERAKRLRQQIESLDSGAPGALPKQGRSLREQIEQRAAEARQREEKEKDSGSKA